jgi:hypothetical protein
LEDLATDGTAQNSVSPAFSLTFLLVHGALHRGCGEMWREGSAPAVTRSMSDVHPGSASDGTSCPEGEYAAVDQDVVRVFEEGELQNAILVGHSFGGDPSR